MHQQLLQLVACDEQLVAVPQLLGQRRLLQLEAPVHVTSHAHASRQSTSLHELIPLHVMAQRPAHTSESHDLEPLHATVQDAAAEQLTLRQPLLPHVIVHW